METIERTIADAIADAALDTYDRRCPKRKKLETGVEWGVLAAVVCTRTEDSGPETSEGVPPQVLTFATGTKCIGRSKMPRDGSAVLDSHAEVVAMRTFRLYLLREIERFYNGNGPTLVARNERGKLQISPGVALHLYISQTPCGDASIFKTAAQSEMSDDEGETRQTTYDTQRTGAKCVAGGPQDTLSSGEGYHEVGALRTKPGRGDPTVCMSCSDKVAMWNVVGCQGALVSHFMDPIYLESVVIGELYDEASLQRALNLRILPVDGLPEPYRVSQVATLRARRLFISGMQQQTQAWTAIAQTQKATDQSNVQDLTETIRKRGHDSATETSEAVHQKNEDTSQKVEHNNVIKTTLPTGESMNKASQSDHQDDKTSQSNRHIPQEALQSDHQGDKNCQQNRRVGKGTSQKKQQRPLSASSRSMNWAADIKEAEVSVLGIREGAKMQNIVPRKARISLCKQRLLEAFTHTLDASDVRLDTECHTYREHKQSSRSYQHAKKQLLTQRFTTWLKNDPIYEAFSLEDVR